MNLYKIYQDICNRGHERGTKRQKGYELHHIIPKSLGGLDIELNLALLTPKEHYVVHHCLAKTGNKKMIFAFHRIIHGKYKFNISANEYEKFRLLHSDAISQSSKGNTNRKGCKLSEYSKLKLSLSKIGKKNSIEHIKANTKYSLIFKDNYYSIEEFAIKFKLNLPSIRATIYSGRTSYKGMNFIVNK